jgi:hypothetical protein
MTASAVSVEDRSMRRIRTEVVPLELINILPQVRDTVSLGELKSLANGIAAMGLQQNPGIVELTLDEIQEYLAKHSQMWGTRLSRSDMVLNFATGTYLIAVFGHRRILAHRHLWSVGCDTCIESFGAEAPGACWNRHLDVLDPDGIEVRITRGLSWSDAMYAQLLENTYIAPERDREAIAWRALWDSERRERPTLTITAFSRMVGRSPAIVSEALRYCELPSEVKAAYAKRHITWSIATELLRLQRVGLDHETVIYWKNYAVIRQPTADKFRRVISSVVSQMSEAQDGMFELEVQEVRRAGLRQDLTRSALTALHHEHVALLARLAALRDGQLPGFVEALRDPSVVRALREAETVHAGITAA